MVRVKTLKVHSNPYGIGLYMVGDEYEDTEMSARGKVAAGIVRIVEQPRVTRAAPEMYLTREVELPKVRLVSRSGSWFFFSDNTKVLGKRAAAEKLGVELEELEGLDVDSNPE